MQIDFRKSEEQFISAPEGQLAVDVAESGTEIRIFAFVGGVRPEDLDIHVTHDLVTVRGSRRAPHKPDRETLHFEECFWGTFSRSVILPHHIDPAKAKAEVELGLLTLTLPKTSDEMQVKPIFA